MLNTRSIVILIVLAVVSILLLSMVNHNNPANSYKEYPSTVKAILNNGNLIVENGIIGRHCIPNNTTIHYLIGDIVTVSKITLDNITYYEINQ